MGSKNRSSFLRPLKNKGFKEEIVTKIGVYDILKSTPLESNKSLFDMAIAQGIGHVPPHTHENNILWKMGSLEADRHRRSPLLFTVDNRRRSYPKGP